MMIFEGGKYGEICGIQRVFRFRKDDDDDGVGEKRREDSHDHQ